MKPQFQPGNNIAMKVPSFEFDRTVAFYRDILELEEIPASSPDSCHSITFKFGDKNLWIDKIEGISQAELWLEIQTNDSDQAAKYLGTQDCKRCDEIEPLPNDFKGFWVTNPSNIVHLVTE